MTKRRSASSSKWLKRQHSDPYTQKAIIEGYRSRAVYKLLEINEKYRIIRPGMRVVDLGAAPGGWSQVAVSYLTSNGVVEGSVIALDILPMEPIEHVEFIQGDFEDQIVFEQLMNLTGSEKIDLVLCDIAPNFMGVKAADIPRSYALAEMALDFAQKVLKQGRGTFLIKLFQGEGIDEMLSQLRKSFSKVSILKPKASRKESREIYVLAQDFRSYC